MFATETPAMTASIRNRAGGMPPFAFSSVCIRRQVLVCITPLHADMSIPAAMAKGKPLVSCLIPVMFILLN